jgi:hypothetical protein
LKSAPAIFVEEKGRNYANHKQSNGRKPTWLR